LRCDARPPPPLLTLHERAWVGAHVYGRLMLRNGANVRGGRAPSKSPTPAGYLKQCAIFEFGTPPFSRAVSTRQQPLYFIWGQIWGVHPRFDPRFSREFDFGAVSPGRESYRFGVQKIHRSPSRHSLAPATHARASLACGLAVLMQHRRAMIWHEPACYSPPDATPTRGAATLVVWPDRRQRVESRPVYRRISVAVV
jgi:hypothetical protein